MLAKQREQTQPDFPGALSSRHLRSQANTLNVKSSGLEESRYEEMQFPALLTLQLVLMSVFKRR